jgi:hypothetical protein
LGERYNGIVEVVGSIPSGSTSFKRPRPATVGAFSFETGLFEAIAFEIKAKRHSQFAAKGASNPGEESMFVHGSQTCSVGFVEG